MAGGQGDAGLLEEGGSSEGEREGLDSETILLGSNHGVLLVFLLVLG